MQPSLVKTKNQLEKKIDSWINGISKTGIMRTSAIPDLSNLSRQGKDHVLVEAIDFNQHICPNHFRKVVELEELKLGNTLAMLDFGAQRVDSSLLKELLAWVDSQKEKIKQLNLATLATSGQAWRYLVDWMLKTKCEIQSIDLGKMKMNLSRTKDIVTLLQEPDINIGRLDFGASSWSFCEVKAFLWMGGLSKSSALTRLALGDAKFCQNGLRLLMKHIALPNSQIQVFSSGVVEIPGKDLGELIDHICLGRSDFLSIVLSNQTLDEKRSTAIARLISTETTLKNLALVNCWYDHGALMDSLKEGKVENLYIEAITAGQIQQLITSFEDKGYRVERQVTRHRVSLKIDSSQKKDSKR